MTATHLTPGCWGDTSGGPRCPWARDNPVSLKRGAKRSSMLTGSVCESLDAPIEARVLLDTAIQLWIQPTRNEDGRYC